MKNDYYSLNDKSFDMCSFGSVFPHLRLYANFENK